ncbi:MAG: hypothetical protein Q7R98_00735 [Candidatus Jorgensenbacteria bacterium]|nr:hypothetical protein [Candidatus Jorgensenbacteria bacterium]
MSAKSEFSVVGLAHKLLLTAEEQGYTPELLNNLAEHPTLFHDMLQVQLGHSDIKLLQYIVDCDAPPFVPTGCKVKKHKKNGLFMLEPAKIETQVKLWTPDTVGIDGYKLYKELKNEPVLNVNILDHFLKYKHLIPESWKPKNIFFWGTIYDYQSGHPCVRYLFWNTISAEWGSTHRCFYVNWDAFSPAALWRMS